MAEACADKLRLHLDADTSIRVLYEELQRRGHDVTRTPNDWMSQDATDEEQLLRATARGRALFSFNARDYMRLAELYPQHAGIILGSQSKWRIGDLVLALDSLLKHLQAEDLARQILWLKPDRR